jgi:hypothetical protein
MRGACGVLWCLLLLAAPASPAEGAGLRGEYFAKSMSLEGDPVLVRVDPVIDFDWAEGAPADEVGANIYSVRWTGFIVAPTAGEYTFHLTSDDGSRLWIDDDLVVDNWGDHAMEERAGRVALATGVPRRVRIEFYENMVYAGVRLEWSAPGLAREVVPAKCLFGPDATFTGPVVATVAAGGGARHTVGSTVKIVVSEASGVEGLSGTVTVRSPTAGYEAEVTEFHSLPDGIYVAKWDTAGLAPAEDYAVEVTLTDAAGNSDPDGLPRTPDVTIALVPAGKMRALDGLEAGPPPPGCAAAGEGAAARPMLVLLALAGLAGRRLSCLPTLPR